MEPNNIMASNSAEEWKIFSPPKMVGGYRMGTGAYSWKLMLQHKPAWFHRTMMKVFFGVVWEDNE